MSVQLIQGIVTLVFMLMFIGCVLWAWSDKRKQAFQQAEQLPLMNDEPAAQKEG